VATTTTALRISDPQRAAAAGRARVAPLGAILVAVLFMLHGLAHGAGLAGIFGLGDTPAENISTLASRLAPEGLAFRLLGVAWLGALAWFVVAAAGLILRRGWWLLAAAVAASNSLALCVVWAEAARVGLVLNVLILGGLAGWAFLRRRRLRAGETGVQPADA
jgi:hypothetical protein